MANREQVSKPEPERWECWTCATADPVIGPDYIPHELTGSKMYLAPMTDIEEHRSLGHDVRQVTR